MAPETYVAVKIHTNMHAFMFCYKHTHMHTFTSTSETANEQALGYLCTTQALKPCTGKSSWGRTSNPQEDCTCPGFVMRGRGTQSST